MFYSEGLETGSADARRLAEQMIGLIHVQRKPTPGCRSHSCLDAAISVSGGRNLRPIHAYDAVSLIRSMPCALGLTDRFDAGGVGPCVKRTERPGAPLRESTRLQRRERLAIRDVGCDPGRRAGRALRPNGCGCSANHVRGASYTAGPGYVAAAVLIRAVARWASRASQASYRLSLARYSLRNLATLGAIMAWQ
jgi:hypothetical protein